MFFDVINVSELTLEFDQKISDCDCNHIPELIFREFSAGVSALMIHELIFRESSAEVLVLVIHELIFRASLLKYRSS